MNWNDHIGKDFRYNTSFNISYNNSKVKTFKGSLQKYWEYDEDGNKTNFVNNISDVSEGGFSGLICEGHRLGETYLRSTYQGTGIGYTDGEVNVNTGPIDGMIRTENDMNWVKGMIDAGYTFMGKSRVAKDQLWYGDLIYADSNEDKDYGNAGDFRFTGKSNIPKYNMGITLGMNYKDFDFSMVWSGQFGFYLYWNAQIYNGTSVSHGLGLSEKIANDHYFYDPENPEDSRTNINASHPRLTFGTALTNRVSSNYYMYRGDYMKLKNMQLGYTLPSSFTQKFMVNKLRAYVSVDNIFTISDYPGQDPEIGTSIGISSYETDFIWSSSYILIDKKNMKNILYFILLLFVPFFSCTDMLQVSPENQISSEKYVEIS